MSDKLIQKAGDNSQQNNIGNIYITNGISEERVREICSETAIQAIANYTLEASEIALKRIDQFVELLLPRIQRIEQDFNSFSEPAFQVLLRKAQLVAACSEREDDYSILSELLVHRIRNKKDTKKKACITKAVEIIDQIDDDSLCAITMYHAIKTFIPLSGNVMEGIKTLSELYKKLNTKELPKDNMWIDNLSILGAISIIPFSANEKFEDYLSKQLGGYVCIGIKKDSEDYTRTIDFLVKNGLNRSLLVDNELLDGYVKLPINTRTSIEDLCFISHEIINGIQQQSVFHLNKSQKNCLYSIFDSYSKDSALQNTVKTNFAQLLNSFEPIKEAMSWWNSLSVVISPTSIGRVVAHTNAKRIDDRLPDLD